METPIINLNKLIVMRKFTITCILIIAVLFSCITLNAQDRCNTRLDIDWIQNNDPSLYQRIQDLENLTSAYANSQNLNNSRLINSNGLIIIPVVVHVLYNTSSQNISDAQLVAQNDGSNRQEGSCKSATFQDVQDL